MESKFVTLLILIVILISVLSITDAASTTNGKLLKFYPITSEQYRSILSLSKQQPIVSEAEVSETHRSLADWSNTLRSSWNTFFNATNSTSSQNDDKAYPICVIKTNDRRRRVARQYQQYNVNYAGLAPNVAYPGSPYYIYPQYSPEYNQLPYVEEDEDIDEDENNDEDDDTENEDNENNDVEEDADDDENNNTNSAPNKDSNPPVINCVVVVRRTNHVTIKPPNSNTEDTDEGSPGPYYPYPYAYQQLPLASSFPYMPQIPPYPINTYPYESSRSKVQSSSTNNKFPVMDHVAALRYQEMIAEYYKYLQSFYMEEASIGTGKKLFQSGYIDDIQEASNEHEENNDDANKNI